MKSIALRHRLFVIVVAVAFFFAAVKTISVFAQARRQPPSSDQKKNKRPEGQPAEEQKQEPLPPDLAGKPQEAEKVTITTNVVNVDAVVYNKKTGAIITGLKKENFAIFVDGVKKEITNFATPEAPITMALVVEYSKLGETFGLYASNGMEPGQYEVIRPTAMFLSRFIKPPEDFVTVIAYDMRPTPLTDFTNDPSRIQQVISLLLRNQPAFTETNLFDALKLTLVGGRGDAVVLEDSKESKADYAGMVAVPGGRRKAVLVVSSGLDTFSKINMDQARKIVQNSGIPLYIIGTGQMFVKKYGDNMDPGRGSSIRGIPIDRMTFLQADNTMKTFANESGGMFFPVTFEGELPNVLGSINAMLRSQYSLGFKPDDARDGKSHKIVVKVDVDLDGQYDDKAYVVKAREIYNAPKPVAASGNGKTGKQ